MGLEYKLEGDKLKVKISYEAGIDQDHDGEMSAKATGGLELEIDGSEALDELLKSSELLQKFKDKLGV